MIQNLIIINLEWNGDIMSFTNFGNFEQEANTKKSLSPSEVKKRLLAEDKEERDSEESTIKKPEVKTPEQVKKELLSEDKDSSEKNPMDGKFIKIPHVDPKPKDEGKEETKEPSAKPTETTNTSKKEKVSKTNSPKKTVSKKKESIKKISKPVTKTKKSEPKTKEVEKKPVEKKDTDNIQSKETKDEKIEYNPINVDDYFKKVYLDNGILKRTMNMNKDLSNILMSRLNGNPDLPTFQHNRLSWTESISLLKVLRDLSIELDESGYSNQVFNRGHIGRLIKARVNNPRGIDQETLTMPYIPLRYTHAIGGVKTVQGKRDEKDPNIFIDTDGNKYNIKEMNDKAEEEYFKRYPKRYNPFKDMDD